MIKKKKSKEIVKKRMTQEMKEGIDNQVHRIAVEGKNLLVINDSREFKKELKDNLIEGLSVSDDKFYKKLAEEFFRWQFRILIP